MARTAGLYHVLSEVLQSFLGLFPGKTQIGKVV